MVNKQSSTIFKIYIAIPISTNPKIPFFNLIAALDIYILVPILYFPIVEKAGIPYLHIPLGMATSNWNKYQKKRYTTPSKKIL